MPAFHLTGAHERIEKAFADGCANCGKLTAFDVEQPEQRIAAWLCQHACSFVLFDTKARATVIGFERKDDADAFRREFIGRK